MEGSSELIQRQEKLKGELLVTIAGESKLAHVNHRLSICLMVIALGCSVAAGAIGFFTNASSKVVGGLAVIPALIAFVAVNLKLEDKSSWHYRKRDELRALVSRLDYPQTELLSSDNIATISNCRNELNAKMQAEWDT